MAFQTLFPGMVSYLKQGLYARRPRSPRRVVSHDGMTVGTTLARGAALRAGSSPPSPDVSFPSELRLALGNGPYGLVAVSPGQPGTRPSRRPASAFPSGDGKHGGPLGGFLTRRFCAAPAPLAPRLELYLRTRMSPASVARGSRMLFPAPHGPNYPSASRAVSNWLPEHRATSRPRLCS